MQPVAFNYVECSLPDGVTLPEYRRSRPCRVSRRRRLAQRMPRAFRLRT